MITLRELVDRGSFLGLKAVALTDHWTTYGHFEFYRLAVKTGIKPILGAEIQHSSLVGSDELYHLTVLAENDEGYRNLVSLVSKHYMKEKGHYVTIDEFADQCGGLIALTGCLKGEAPQAILHGNLARAREVIEKLSTLVGPDNLFLEVMNHNLPEERLVIDHLALLSKRLKLPLVATNNDRYAQKDAAQYYTILHMLHEKDKSTEKHESPGEFYFKREKELEPFFYGLDEALGSSGEIADRCNVDLDWKGRIEFTSLLNPHDTINEMCSRRFLLKFHNRSPVEQSHLRTVLEHELEDAKREGLAAFLLFLKDLFDAASKRGIWIEIMGGNLLTSFTAYLLGIVPLNPIDHGLIYESISVSQGIPLPIELVTPEESKEKLIEIIMDLLPDIEPLFTVMQEEMSFQTIVKEICGLFGLTPDVRDNLSKHLTAERRHKTLAQMLEGSEPLMHLYNSEEGVRRALHAAEALRGRIHHFHMNTSRILLLPRDIRNATSFITGPNDERFALLSTLAIESMGGWTLGIQHSHFLSTLERAVDVVGGRKEISLSLYQYDETGGGKWVPELLDDPQTYRLISSGDTSGVYLLESQGVRDLLMTIKPTSFGELVNVISLYRPGPLEGRLGQKYIDNAEKKGKVYLPHPTLAAALESTRGIMLYREQVKEILKYSAGMNEEKALELENALRSRDSGELFSARLDFIRGAMDNGIDEEDATKIFDYLLHNIAFTHDKALSCSQAYLSYRTAFFKAHFFEQYFISLLNSNLDVRERLKKYIEYLKGINIEILPVDINFSQEGYAFTSEGVREPLKSVKQIESSEYKAILQERSERGEFQLFNDFLERLFGLVSMKAVLGLIEHGAFDAYGISHGELTGLCKDFFEGGGKVGIIPPSPVKISPKGKKKVSKRQMGLFD